MTKVKWNGRKGNTAETKTIRPMTKWNCRGRKDNSEYSLVSSLGNWKDSGIANMNEAVGKIYLGKYYY